jgi:lipopolysaccharide export system permease protein
LADLKQRLANLPDDKRALTEALDKEIQVHHVRLARLEAEVARRMSNGFGCLCFAMIGIPVAMRSRSSDTMSVFFKCFVPILVVYYPLLVTGEEIARAGIYPQYSVWLADAVLLFAGLVLFVRNARH